MLCITGLFAFFVFGHVSDYRRSIDAIYNFDFEWNKIVHEHEIDRDLSRVLHSWNAFLLANETEFYDTVSIVNDRYRNVEKNASEERLMHLYASLVLMRMKAIQGSFWGTLKSFREGEQDLKYFLKKETKNDREKLVVALYHTLAGAAATNSMKIKILLLTMPSPDEEMGVELLKRLTQSTDVFVAGESAYFMGKYYAEIKDNKKEGLPYFLKLHRKYPNNPVFIFECARLSDDNKVFVDKLKDVVNNQLKVTDFQKETFIQTALNRLEVRE